MKSGRGLTAGIHRQRTAGRYFQTASGISRMHNITGMKRTAGILHMWPGKGKDPHGKWLKLIFGQARTKSAGKCGSMQETYSSILITRITQMHSTETCCSRGGLKNWRIMQVSKKLTATWIRLQTSFMGLTLILGICVRINTAM